MINKKKNALAPTKKNSVLCPPINAVPVSTTTSNNNKQQKHTTRTHTGTHNTNRQQQQQQKVLQKGQFRIHHSQ